MTGSLLLPSSLLPRERPGWSPLQGMAGDCIDACRRCAAETDVCADISMADPSLARLASRLRMELNTTEVCRATARRLAGGEEVDADGAVLAQVSACAEVCDLTAEAVSRHARAHEAYRRCVEACRACAAACRRLLEA